MSVLKDNYPLFSIIMFRLRVNARITSKKGAETAFFRSLILNKESTSSRLAYFFSLKNGRRNARGCSVCRLFAEDHLTGLVGMWSHIL